MKTTPDSLTTRSKAANAPLRGLAIIAVVGLHILASLRPETFLSPERQIFSIPLDQFARFCVPMFVMLSGYAFYARYAGGAWSWKLYFQHFLYRQAQKLLPAYLLASAVFVLLFTYVYQWRLSISPAPYWHQLLFGEADYHLYFVPMIFQMYLAFPVLLWGMKKLPWLMMGATLAFQVFLYSAFSAPEPSYIVKTYFLTDQVQYMWFFTWIWYAVLGMGLARCSLEFLTRKVWLVGLLALALVGWGWASWESLTMIRSGIDAIIALRSTRLAVLLSSSAICALLFSVAVAFFKEKSAPIRGLSKLGDWSYWIYLFHTIALRVVFYL